MAFAGAEPAAARLLLLRHGEVGSHRGDVPVTAPGLETARSVGRLLGVENRELQVLSGNTLRTKQTALAVAEGARAAGAEVHGPQEAFALRNPDLYLAGHRVDMVSTAAAFADQVPRLTAEQVGRVGFFAGFLTAPERIGWWLRHPDPPGDDAAAVRERIADFARSLLDGVAEPPLTIAVTHSPVIRACVIADGRHDPEEPPWVGGVQIDVSSQRTVRMRWIGSVLAEEVS